MQKMMAKAVKAKYSSTEARRRKAGMLRGEWEVKMKYEKDWRILSIVIVTLML